MWRRAFQIDADRTGNLPPPPGIFPNTAAPIAHIAQGRRVLSMYRWGMSSPAFALGASGSIPVSPTCAALAPLARARAPLSRAALRLQRVQH
ncbi:hypothetical protein JCM2811A_02230 [Methylorubrum rhodinum]